MQAIRFKQVWMGVVLATGLAGPVLAETAAPSLSPERAAGNVVQMVGSTLMKPYATALSERLTQIAGLPPMILDTRGSGRGIEAFCAGVGLDTPDIVAVSRRLRTTEFQRCQEHGVNDVIEILVGYEAGAVVSRADDQTYALTLKSLYEGIAAELPEGFKFVPNPHQRWREMDKELPDTEIRFLMPVPSLGGRAFVEDRLLQGACRNIFEIKTIFAADERVRQCIALRQDGRVIELDAPYDVKVAQTLAASPTGTLSILPLRFASLHKDTLKVQPLEGVLPNAQTVASREYRFTRPLYFFVKKAHIQDYKGKGLVRGLREFITEVTRESTIGPEGYLVDLGVFPVDAEQRAEVRKASLNLTSLER